MTVSYFGFSEPPFSNTPDPKFFSPTMSQRKALNALRSGVKEKKGFLVLTGDIGTGKTTLSRTLLRILDREIATALVLNSDLSEEEILKAILMDFGIAIEGLSKFDLMERLYSYLADRTSLGRTSLIVVDDAQNLPARSLEQIRMISNFETDKEKLVQILLVGQPELDEKLNSHKFRQLNQRIAVREKLNPLFSAETVSYVQQRLVCAGGDAAGGIFSQEALKAVHRETGGYPRTVNALCDRVLTEAYRAQRKTVSVPMVREAAGALGLRKARRDRLKERLLGFRWHAAASLTAAAAVAAVASLQPDDRSSVMNVRTPAGWERRFSAMERSLFAMEQKLSSLRVQAPPAVSTTAPAAGPGSGSGDAKSSAEELRKKLRATEAELQKEEQRKTRELQRIEGELDRMRRKLHEKLIENEALAQELSLKEGDLSGVGEIAENSDVTLSIIEQLRVENSELSEQQEAIKRTAARTIQHQNKQIERLTLERKKLLETLKKMKDIDSSDKTTMLSVGPQ